MKLQEKFKKKYKVDALDFVEKANLKGLYQALTLYTWVFVNFVSTIKIADNTRHNNP